MDDFFRGILRKFDRKVARNCQFIIKNTENKVKSKLIYRKVFMKQPFYSSRVGRVNGLVQKFKSQRLAILGIRDRKITKSNLIKRTFGEHSRTIQEPEETASISLIHDSEETEKHKQIYGLSQKYSEYKRKLRNNQILNDHKFNVNFFKDRSKIVHNIIKPSSIISDFRSSSTKKNFAKKIVFSPISNLKDFYNNIGFSRKCF